jgi:hypothetical protein
MKDWVIFGCSPFISKIQDYNIKAVKVGVNLFHACPVDYRVCNDVGAITYAENHKLSGKRVFLTTKIKAAGINVDADYWYDDSAEIQHEWTGSLLSYYTSALPAINFAYLKGAKNIYLAGIDLNWETGHYYDEPPEMEKPKFNIESMPYRERHRLEAGYYDRVYKGALTRKVQFIVDKIREFQKYVNIYRANSDRETALGFLPYKSIKCLK